MFYHDLKITTNTLRIYSLYLLFYYFFYINLYQWVNFKEKQ